MKAFLIDPYAKAITEVDYDGDYKNIYKLIDCRCFTVVGPVGDEKLAPRGEFNEPLMDSVYIDDEGMLSGDNPVWTLRTMPGVSLAKKGLVLGVDNEGESVAVQTTDMDWLEANIVWTDKVSTGDFGPSREGVMDHPIFGPTPTFFGGQPLLKDKADDESVEG